MKKRMRRLESALRVVLGQSRPIRWFPLLGVSLQGFIYLCVSLGLALLLFFLLFNPG